MAHVLFMNSMTPNIRPSQPPLARMANFARKFITTSTKQAVFPAGRFLDLMVTFVLRAVTDTIRQVSELVIRSLMPMANSLVVHSLAAQVRSEKNSAGALSTGFSRLKRAKSEQGPGFHDDLPPQAKRSREIGVIDYLQKGGLLMWPILACSIISIGVFAERLFYLHRATIHVGEFLKGLSNLIRRRNFAEALHESAGTPGPVARVIHSAIIR